MTTSVVVDSTTTTVEVAHNATSVTAPVVQTTVAIPHIEVTVVTAGTQGPPGTPGPTAEGEFLQVLNYLGEFSTQQQKADARTNLELNYIDCGTFN